MNPDMLEKMMEFREKAKTKPAGTGATIMGPTLVTFVASSVAMAGISSVDTDWMGEIIF